jgi:hypothetical protein
MQKVRRYTLLLGKVVFRLLIELLIHDLFHHSTFSNYLFLPFPLLLPFAKQRQKKGQFLIIEENKNK